MRDTLRDFMIAVAAVAALFASFQAWSNGVEIAGIKVELAKLNGAMEVTTSVVTEHVSAAGLHR